MLRTALLLGGLLLASARVALAAVDINTATAEDFDRLKAVGPVKARAIVEFRAKHGPFKSIEDLRKVPGMGGATYEAIKREITVGPARPAAHEADKGASKVQAGREGAARSASKPPVARAVPGTTSNRTDAMPGTQGDKLPERTGERR